MLKAGQRRLTPDDWAAAALAAIARGGVAAVAVESIAAELGATKGSFYWHFRNRDALIEAALDRWEQLRTDAFIDVFETEPDPAQRVKMIIRGGLELPVDRAEIALLAHPDHPAAVRAVRRVAERRISYIAEQLAKLGWSRRDARDRAVHLYFLYVGHLQTTHVVPDLIDASARRRALKLVFDAFVATS